MPFIASLIILAHVSAECFLLFFASLILAHVLGVGGGFLPFIALLILAHVLAECFLPFLPFLPFLASLILAHVSVEGFLPNFP